MGIKVGRVRLNERGYKNIKVDRSSHLGNPFYMANELMRDEVCDKYEDYFQEQVKIPKSNIRLAVISIYRMAKEQGHSINLQCHCAPKRCHADTIKRFLDKHLDI